MDTQDYERVFVSTITRNDNSRKDELYNLLKVSPAEPLAVIKDESHPCYFCPKTGKPYVPKKKSKLKVKTVREIRSGFEQDIYACLPNDLIKQQNVLLKKIKGATLNNEGTKSLAKNILKSEQPITRTTWLMLANVNPDGNKYSTQFVLWNGKNIQVNGSKGGNNKFISNVDLGNIRFTTTSKSVFKKKLTNKRNCLLRNSLNIKFKPGPLGKKKYLDDSHQKYHVGGIELIDLPKPGLDIQPVYGTTLEPTITNFLNNLRDKDGVISKKWAEFSVSVLGKIKNSSPVQISKDYVSFDLGYRYEQHRILMRSDRENENTTVNESDDAYGICQQLLRHDPSTVMSEIKEVVNKMLDSIEISFEQDNMFGSDEPRPNYENTACSKLIQVKDKAKRKYGELDRLDVTIIQMPENQPRDSGKICNKSHCVLGCVCDSLECRFKLKQHCGRIGCMFACNCDFSKCTDLLKSECTSMLPGLINLNNQINFKLSKEEQKFHQTVIVTGDKSILLKSQKRHCKISKRYADFYTNMSLKTHVEIPKRVSISCLKLNCESIEPWCMVHNLYKCFCKGKFIEVSNSNSSTESTTQVLPQNDINDGTNLKDNNMKSLRPRNRSSAEDEHNKEEAIKKEVRSSTDGLNKRLNKDDHDSIELDTPILYSTCARTKKYFGRKYSNAYYNKTNKKILEMEKNDHKLRKRMVALMAIEESSTSKKCDDTTLNVDGNSNSDFKESVSFASEVACTPAQCREEQSSSRDSDVSSDASITTFTTQYLPNKKKLISWLECNYKLYKKRMDQGLIKALPAPSVGRMTIHSWEFLLNRYRGRKNLFLVTKQKPYRIFVAINMKNPFFENTINIDDIRFADIHKYPNTVQNLLSNAEYGPDSFCILCGLSSCWELVGSVTKVQEFLNQDQNKKDNNLNHSSGNTPKSIVIDGDTNEMQQSIHENTSSELQTNSPNSSNVCIRSKKSEISKWFVMTIENDFTEIQFYRRGFFVKLDSIMRAINVARISGKTVRLSSQKCVDKSSGPQFGLYAIPNTSEHCVFIGPYEMDETLGIETVKVMSDIRKTKRTRGVWITTNTVDNLKVIDNPMSFILPTKYQEMVPLDSEKGGMPKTLEMKRGGETLRKPVKPIKVRKTDGFFLATDGTIRKISPHKIETDIGKSLTHSTLGSLSALKPLIQSNIIPESKHCEKPLAVTEPGKIQTRPERGMFILKPEEINKKLLERKRSFHTDVFGFLSDEVKTDPGVMELDIEQFITSTTVFMPPPDDTTSISLLSDDDEDQGDNLEPGQENVFIQSTNIKGLGWIRGKRHKGLLSFQFPGFTYSPFYKAEETFSKINEVFSRKIYIPKNIKLKWEVVQTVDASTSELKDEDLNSSFIMTKQGIKPKELVLPKGGIIKTYSRNLLKDLSLDSPSTDESESSSDSVDETSRETFSELEQTHTRLEDETNELWSKTILNGSAILETLRNVPNNLRHTMTDSLESIKEKNSQE